MRFKILDRSLLYVQASFLPPPASRENLVLEFSSQARSANTIARDRMKNPILIRLSPLQLPRITAILAGFACWLWIPTVFAQSPVDPNSAPAGEAKTEITRQSKGVRIEKDQRFSDQAGKAGLCDLYLPAVDPPKRGYPVVVLVHGGGWISGDKWTLAGYSRLLATHGFAAITINYRLAPDHKFPAQVDDVRSALIWAKENANRLKFNLDRLGIFGYSAGGHLSTLVASLADETIEVQAAASDWPSHDKKWGELPSIRAVCAGGPPCDFRSLPVDNNALAYFLGGSRRERPENYIAASPAAHVSPADPVTQIIHGDSDLLVPLKGSQEFHEAQVAAGVDSRLEVMPNQGHMVTFLNPKTSRKVIAFFDETLEDDSSNE